MDQMRQVADASNMADIVFVTVVGQNVFSDPWNQTDDIFEEPQPGLLSEIFGHKTSGVFVYNRCGSLAGELQLFPLVPLDPSEVKNEWNIITKVYNKCPQCNKPAPTTQPQDETTPPSQ